MRLEIELPDWCDERHIYILAGIELAAYKQFGEDWKVKTDKCVQCGECCTGLKPHKYMDILPDGTCTHLGYDGTKRICEKGGLRGFNCCTSDPAMGNRETNCKVRYK